MAAHIDAATKQYDGYKVHAQGNYTTSAPQPGGYQNVNGHIVPGPVVASALDYLDNQLARLLAELSKRGLSRSTDVIVTAKHGQSPIDPSKLVTVADGPIVSAINAAWAQTHPDNSSLIVAGTNDDLWQSYLSDRSQAAADFVSSYLYGHTAQGYDVTSSLSPSSTPASPRSTRGQRLQNYSGCPSTTGATPTCSARSRRASSKPSRPSSLSTAA